MWRVAADAAFARCLVLEHKRSLLLAVALEARLVCAEQGKASALDRLWKTRPAPFHGPAFMRIVAIDAAHFAFQDGVMMGQLELGTHFEMALKTGIRRFARIDDGLGCAPALDVQASRSVTRFTTHHLGVFSMRLQARVRGGRKVFGDRLVTSGARFGSDKIGPGNTRRSKDSMFGRAAGKQNNSESERSACAPEKFFASTEKPSS